MKNKFQKLTGQGKVYLTLLSPKKMKLNLIFIHIAQNKKQYMDMEEVYKEERIRDIAIRLLKNNHIDLEKLKGNKTIKDDIIGKLKQNYQMPGRRISRALGT